MITDRSVAIASDASLPPYRDTEPTAPSLQYARNSVRDDLEFEDHVPSWLHKVHVTYFDALPPSVLKLDNVPPLQAMKQSPPPPTWPYLDPGSSLLLQQRTSNIRVDPLTILNADTVNDGLSSSTTRVNRVSGSWPADSPVAIDWRLDPGQHRVGMAFNVQGADVGVSGAIGVAGTPSQVLNGDYARLDLKVGSHLQIGVSSSNPSGTPDGRSTWISVGGTGPVEDDKLFLRLDVSLSGDPARGVIGLEGDGLKGGVYFPVGDGDDFGAFLGIRF